MLYHFSNIYKNKKDFTGFDPKHKLTSILNEMLSKNDPDFAKKPDIKWNFTKFLVDKSGNVVARFEPTTSAEEIEKEIEKTVYNLNSNMIIL